MQRCLSASSLPSVSNGMSEHCRGEVAPRWLKCWKRRCCFLEWSGEARRRPLQRRLDERQPTSFDLCGSLVESERKEYRSREGMSDVWGD